MTDAEATRIVAEAMGLEQFDEPDFADAWKHPDERMGVFDPCTDANDENDLVRPWAVKNLTIEGLVRVAWKMPVSIWDMATGKLTHAVAQVLKGRLKEATDDDED